jgi:hypothetical protein
MQVCHHAIYTSASGIVFALLFKNVFICLFAGLNNRQLFLHGSGGWKSEIKALGVSIPSEVSLPDL